MRKWMAEHEGLVILICLVSGFCFMFGLCFYLRGLDNEVILKKKALCGKDHWAGQTWVADGLYRIECISANGESRFIFVEEKP